jgi:hypothetical protein
MASVPADADAIADFPTGRFGPECIDRAGDLVPRRARKGETGPNVLDRDDVAVANAASLDFDPRLAGTRFGYGEISQVQTCIACRRYDRCSHFHYSSPGKRYSCRMRAATLTF